MKKKIFLAGVGGMLGEAFYLEFSKDYFGDDETFGKIDPKVFDDFFKWIKSKEIESFNLKSSQFYIDLEF